jgi:gliding motility-associated-like protein
MNYTPNLKQTLLTLLVLMAIAVQSNAQAVLIRVRVTQVQALLNRDCDAGFIGIGNTDSDFVWEFEATDNTIGFGNNNPELLTNFNYVHYNENNGPYTQTPNNLFFEHQYICASVLPSTINVVWEAYENDNAANYAVLGIGKDGSTGDISNTIAVPAAGNTNTQTFFATGGGGCNQQYSITFSVEVIGLTINYLEDAICNAPQVPANGATFQYGWCGSTTEPGEPVAMSVGSHGSGWVYFVAPASGRLDISTDLPETDFGTEIVIYHAADGAGCTAGVAPSGTQVKQKFEYLSYVDEADLGGFLNLGGQADIVFDDCNNIFSSTPLVAGETYYIQVSSDDAGEVGYVGLNLDPVGGSPSPAWDIPCRARDISNAAIQTGPISLGAGSAPSTALDLGCATARETGDPNTNNGAGNYQAYDYNHGSFNNGSIHESVWVRFTAPNSGRIRFETDLGNLDSENSALFGLDNRFAPDVPAGYSCANLSFIAAGEGGVGGILGGNASAVINGQCLEPGYTYYGMIDPATINFSGDAEVWAYDPSVADPSQNPPGNDILCLALADPFYEVPVELVGGPAGYAVPGFNTRACIERLAGEPNASPTAANRADQTTWHYFTAPPSGAADLIVRAFTMQQVRVAVYPLLNGTDCYGGLQPATYTIDGTNATQGIAPVATGTAGILPSTISLCCMVPGTLYAIQVDGGSPGDEGIYVIDRVREVEVNAGDTYLTQANGVTVYDSTNTTAYVCAGDPIHASVELDLLGNSTANIPACMDTGYVVHTSNPVPNPIANVGFSFLASALPGTGGTFINDGTIPRNQLLYISSLADEDLTWGQLTCNSASAENAIPVVFLSPISVSSNFDNGTCLMTFTPVGGMPAYDNTSLFNWVVLNVTGDTLFSGTASNSQTITLQAPAPLVFTVVVTDAAGCSETINIDGTGCTNPCVINTVFVTPNPLDSTIYTCLGNGTAIVTLFLNGGDPVSNGTNYSVQVSGSSVAGMNQTYSVAPAGGPQATSFSFTVADGDTWTVIAGDINICPDTVSGTFEFNLTNCPNACQIVPVVISPDPLNNLVYSCLPGGQAVVTLNVAGGAPSINGSDYLVTVTGSTVAGVNVSNQVLSPSAATAYSFTVNDGDTWTFSVVDNFNCTDAASNTFVFNPLNCPDICTIQPLTVFPDPLDSSIYSCNFDGTATITLNITGGHPSYTPGNYTISVSGSSAGANVTGQQVFSADGLSTIYTFDVADNDTWTFIVADTFGCADTLSSTFTFDLTNCPLICQQTPLLIIPNPADSTIYTCNPDGSATAVISFAGGKPFYDGSNYFVTLSGSTVPGNNVTGQAYAGQAGGSVNYAFSVNDGDIWTVVITDEFGLCTDTVTAQYLFNATNCSNICQLAPLFITPDPLNTSIYTCNGDGTATVTLTLSGGRPNYDGSNYSATISGSSVPGQNTVQSIPGVIGGTATLSFLVGDGDNWSVDVEDTQNCTDQAQGLFQFNIVNCPNFCQLLPLAILPDPIDSTVYTCYPNQTALVTVTLSGGRPSYDGSNYIVSVYGSSVGGNAINVPVAGIAGGTVTYSFLVGDFDQWQILVEDQEGCSDFAGGQFFFTNSNCDNICADPTYTGILINGGSDNISYICDGNGFAQVLVTLTGGLPALDNGLTAYEVISTVNGINDTTYVQADTNGVYTYVLNIIDGDVWQVNATDTLDCSTDNLGGTAGTLFNSVTAIASASTTEAILVGQTVQLTGSASIGNNLSYTWTPSTGLDNANIANPVSLPLQTTTYVLQVEDDFDCADTAQVLVRVGPCVPQTAGFTPNADGINDTWVIPCFDIYDNETKVYNRWGELVFSQVNYQGDWDGTSNGKPLPDGTYYYVIDVFYPNGQSEVLKGNVTIIR